MSRLAQLQASFQAYILDKHNDEFKQSIIDDVKVGADKRLSIYADAYRLRIIEALKTAYPKLYILLGDDLFDTTASQYIDQYPSRYRNMRWVGNQMPQHLTKVLPQHPIAAELASFEWALGLAFDAEDMPVLQRQDLSTVPTESWGDLRFKMHSAVQLLDLQWNVIPVWQALDNEESPPLPKEVDTPCLIWRADLNSHYRSMSLQEFKSMQQIAEGASFGDMCESLYVTLEDAATQQAAQYLASWLEAGLIALLNKD